MGRTNDTFSGQSGLDLLSITGTQTFDLVAYDAGTEVNTELATDRIAFGGNGHVSENGVIHLSDGIRGIDHYENGLGVDVNGIRTDIPADWRFTDPVARITVTAVPEPGSLTAFLGIGTLSLSLLVRRRYRTTRSSRQEAALS